MTIHTPRQPDSPALHAPTSHARRTTGGPSPVRHRFGFVATAFAFLMLMAFSTVPSPLYGLYARHDHFSSLTITLIYAAYAAGVIASLIFAGHLSDILGRRPLLVAAIALDAASVMLFLAWPSLAGLYAARIVCGLSVGITSSTATAWLHELAAGSRPGGPTDGAQVMSTVATLGGLGLGAAAAGLIAQVFGDPFHLPYVVWLVILAVSTAGLMATPETRSRPHPLPPYRPQRLVVPADAASRRRFGAAALGVAVLLAVAGLFVGLAGVFLTSTWHQTSIALAGLTIFTVFAAGVVTAIVTATWPLRRTLASGVVSTLAGVVGVTMAAWLRSPSLALFLVGGALIGAGLAWVFKGTLTTTVMLAPPDRRAGMLTTYFLAAYVGLSIPVVGLGIGLQFATPRVVLLVFAVIVAAALIAVSPSLLRRPQER